MKRQPPPPPPKPSAWPTKEVIEAKVKAGLTRAQAIAVIKRQRLHDEFVASERKNRLPALLKIIATHKRDLREARRLAREDFPFLDGGEWAAALEAFKKIILNRDNFGQRHSGSGAQRGSEFVSWRRVLLCVDRLAAGGGGPPNFG